MIELNKALDNDNGEPNTVHQVTLGLHSLVTRWSTTQTSRLGAFRYRDSGLFGSTEYT
jgi:hypothetical protein